jgi:hypothetical protein
MSSLGGLSNGENTMGYTSTGGIQGAASAALTVASDPALSTVVSLVAEIKALSSKSSSSAPSGPGIGLSAIVTPLRGFVAYKKHPWILPAFFGGVVLGIFSLGAMSGRHRQRKSKP